MRRFSLSFAVAPGMPIWQVSQLTRLFWISSISPRRQQSSSAPTMRSCSSSPTYRWAAVFIDPERRIEQPLFLFS